MHLTHGHDYQEATAQGKDTNGQVILCSGLIMLVSSDIKRHLVGLYIFLNLLEFSVLIQHRLHRLTHPIS